MDNSQTQSFVSRRWDESILPQLVDYKVRIPPGGKTGALVETLISWQTSARAQPFSTIGVDPDQLAAAVIATEKMLNLIAARRKARP